MHTPIPSQPPSVYTLPTTSEEQVQFHDVAFDISGNPSSTEKNGGDTNRKDNQSHSVIQSLQTEITDNSASSRWKKLRLKSEYLVLVFAILVLLVAIITLPSINSTLNTKMDKHQQAFIAALSANSHYEAVDVMDEARTIYVGNYYGWSFAWYRDAAYRK